MSSFNNKGLEEKLSEITTELTGMNTRIDWLETKLDEIKKEQEEGEKRQKYLIEKQVELYVLIKNGENKVTIEFDNKIKGTTKFT